MTSFMRPFLASALSEGLENSSVLEDKLSGVEAGIARVEKAILCQEKRQDQMGSEPGDQVRHVHQSEEASEWYQSSKVELKILQSQRYRKSLQAGCCCPCYYFLMKKEMKLVSKQMQLYEKEQAEEEAREEKLYQAACEQKLYQAHLIDNI